MQANAGGASWQQAIRASAEAIDYLGVMISAIVIFMHLIIIHTLSLNLEVGHFLVQDAVESDLEGSVPGKVSSRQAELQPQHLLQLI